MPTVNIGILAHVDAGKTSLTERLLFDAGVIDRLGSVDAGSTQTDTGEIERQRGITVRSAVASFAVGDLRVNLVDTPGHSDFIAEVERALGVLDGAVLVLSAVEGVQPQTRVLMRTLHAMRLPTVIFVNKIDRAGARHTTLLADIRRRLTRAIVPVTTAVDIGTPAARVVPVPDPYEAAAEVLADNDDALLEALVSGPRPTADAIGERLAAQTAAGLVHPVLFGSALSGEGIGALVDAVARLLPPARTARTAPNSPNNRSDRSDRAGEPRGTVFAVQRGGTGAATAYLRLDSGVLRARQRVTVHRREAGGETTRYSARVTGLQVVGAPDDSVEPLTAGNLGVLRGLPGARVGDRIGAPDETGDGTRFARPSLETLVRPRVAGEEARLHAALVALADQDPLIRTRAVAGEGTSVLLYGEVQKEIIAATLAADFGVEAVFEPSRTVYSEQPAGVGEAVEEWERQQSPRFVATVGFRVEPAPPGTGVGYGLEIEIGTLPYAFQRAIEETVRRTLDQGLHGWPITDCRVTLTRATYDAPVTTAADFRGLTPLVLMRAVARAGTRVHEPCHEYEVEVPVGSLGAVTVLLASLGADIRDSAGDAEVAVLKGEIPARRVPTVERRLPGLSHGEGVWWSRPSSDRPLPGRPPERARTDGNPLDRAEYLRYLNQRAGTVRT